MSDLFIHHSLNKSPSKSSFSFAKAKRFDRNVYENVDRFYDLPPPRVRTVSIGKKGKSKLKGNTVVLGPSPGAY